MLKRRWSAVWFASTRRRPGEAWRGLARCGDGKAEQGGVERGGGMAKSGIAAATLSVAEFCGVRRRRGGVRLGGATAVHGEALLGLPS